MKHPSVMATDTYFSSVLATGSVASESLCQFYLHLTNLDDHTLGFRHGALYVGLKSSELVGVMVLCPQGLLRAVNHKMPSNDQTASKTIVMMPGKQLQKQAEGKWWRNGDEKRREWLPREDGGIEEIGNFELAVSQ